MIAVRAAIAVFAVAGLLACGSTAREIQTVEIGGRGWDVLVGDEGGMRGFGDFMGADGMLFVFENDVDPSAVGWVMDGVAFPLDIAWFAGDGSLVGVAAMATCPEGSAATCPQYASPGPFRWAVEAPAGTFDDLPADARLELAP